MGASREQAGKISGFGQEQEPLDSSGEALALILPVTVGSSAAVRGCSWVETVLSDK